MKKALVYSAIALPVLAIGSISQPSVASAQTPGNWSGSYANVTAGGAWGTSSQHDNGTVSSGGTSIFDGRYHIGGALGGAGLGYNWQNGPWVAGLTADISGGNVRGQSNSCGGVADTCGTKLNELVTTRGIWGYANGMYLTYITAGAGWGDIHAWDSLSGNSGSKIQAGLAVGGGFEVKFDPRASFKVEYLYVDFGKANIFNIAPGTPERVSTNVNIVRAGLTYYFSSH
jgi:outer membrane immunogenic protein